MRAVGSSDGNGSLSLRYSKRGWASFPFTSTFSRRRNFGSKLLPGRTCFRDWRISSFVQFSCNKNIEHQWHTVVHEFMRSSWELTFRQELDFTPTPLELKHDSSLSWALFVLLEHLKHHYYNSTATIKSHEKLGFSEEKHFHPKNAATARDV